MEVICTVVCNNITSYVGEGRVLKVGMKICLHKSQISGSSSFSQKFISLEFRFGWVERVCNFASFIPLVPDIVFFGTIMMYTAQCLLKQSGPNREKLQLSDKAQHVVCSHIFMPSNCPVFDHLQYAQCK